MTQINAAMLVERVGAGPEVDSLIAVLAIAGLIGVAGDRFAAAAHSAAKKGWVY